VDASIAARLRAVAVAYDVAILLPDRTVSPTASSRPAGAQTDHRAG